MRKLQEKERFFFKETKENSQEKSTEIVKRATIILVKLGGAHLHLSKDHE